MHVIERYEGALREKIKVVNASHIRRWYGFPAKDDTRYSSYTGKGTVEEKLDNLPLGGFCGECRFGLSIASKTRACDLVLNLEMGESTRTSRMSGRLGQSS